MGLVKFGSGIVQISGAIGGDVHARNRFGNYIRPRTKPINPRSERQEEVRAVLSYLAERWHGDLTVAQRAAWEVYAAAVSMLNRLGETIYLTGYNHYIRSNTIRLYIGAAVIDTAPIVMSLPEKDPVTQCSEETIAAQTFTFICSALIWGVGADTLNGIALYMGLPQLASRNYFNGPWRYMGIIDPAEGAVGQAVENAPYPFGLGQKVWFKARMLTMSARLSVEWILNPRTIEVDP